MSEDYSPSKLVTSTHHILHLNSRLHLENNNFNISTDSYWNSYSRSLIPIPAICMSLGLIAVLILQFSLCASMCLKACQCESKEGDSGNSPTKQRPPHYGRLSAMLLFSGFFTLAIIQILFVGRAFITNGVNDSEDTVDYLSDVFNNLVNYGSTLNTYGQTLESDFIAANSSGCAAGKTLESYMPTYYNYVNEYSDYVDPVPNQLSKISDKLSLWGIHYQNYTIWALYFVVVLSLVMFFGGYWWKSKNVMRIGIAISEFILVAFFLLVGAEMVVLMGLADFCMDPVKYSTTLVPSDIYNLTSYYTTCAGVNPVASIVSESESFLKTYEQAVEASITMCPGNTYLTDALATLHKADVVLTNITSDISCPPTQSQIIDLLQTGLCDKVFKGYFVVWISQYGSAGFLLLTTIVVAIIYQYFGAYWDAPDEPVQGTYYDYGDEDATQVVNPAARWSSGIGNNVSEL